MLATGRWGVMSGLQLYRSILADIRRSDYDVFNKHPQPNTSQKIKLVAKSWLATFR
jgi:phytoene/squalene synthetase